jgi:hypothetical protein
MRKPNQSCVARNAKKSAAEDVIAAGGTSE